MTVKEIAAGFKALKDGAVRIERDIDEARRLWYGAEPGRHLALSQAEKDCQALAAQIAEFAIVLKEALMKGSEP
jgi:hypothetical protein